MAKLIRHAPRVELFELAAGDATFSLDGRPRASIRSANVSRALGLVHARHSLIVDQNFEWDQLPPHAEIDWDLVIRFSDGADNATVLLDYDSRAVKLLGSEKSATLHPKIVEGMRDYANRQLPSSSN